MAHVSASIDIPVSPEEIWQLISGFGSLILAATNLRSTWSVAYQLRALREKGLIQINDRIPRSIRAAS